MKNRTRSEITAEIEALKRLKPCGVHKHTTQAKIDIAIEELTFGWDQTAEEWNELSDGERDAVNVALSWKEGHSHSRPSKGWGSLVE